METCASRDLDTARQRLGAIVAEVRRLLGGRPAAVAFEKAQSAWAEFVRADCDAVYANHEGGSIRSFAQTSCAMVHTETRSCGLWQVYLRGMETSVADPCEGEE
jgi:uncharacterized protein YecT (DUF1311 family)